MAIARHRVTKINFYINSNYNEHQYPEKWKKSVVIVGGGLGGLRLAEDLYVSGMQVVLIDKNNFHQFSPLIYQIASAGIDPSSISFPFR